MQALRTPANQQLSRTGGVGFPHRVGQHRFGGPPFSSPGCWSCRCRIFDAGIVCPPRVQRDLDFPQRGNSCRALAPQTPGNQQSASIVGVSIPCMAVSTRGIAVFVAGVLGLHMYGNIAGIAGSGDNNLPSPGAAGHQICPEGQLSQCAGSMSSSQSAISRWGWGFYNARGGIDPG